MSRPAPILKLARGTCPHCRHDRHGAIEWREERPVRREEHDPAVAAAMMASLGLMSWEEALAVKSDPQVVLVAEPLRRSITTECLGCGTRIEWNSWAELPDHIEVKLPVSWTRAYRPSAT